VAAGELDLGDTLEVMLGSEGDLERGLVATAALGGGIDPERGAIDSDRGTVGPGSSGVRAAPSDIRTARAIADPGPGSGGRAVAAGRDLRTRRPCRSAASHRVSCSAPRHGLR
jgi:hypothetical protein